MTEEASATRMLGATDCGAGSGTWPSSISGSRAPRRAARTVQKALRVCGQHYLTPSPAAMRPCMLLITSWAISRCCSAAVLLLLPLLEAAVALLMASAACCPAICAELMCCSAAICVVRQAEGA